MPNKVYDKENLDKPDKKSRGKSRDPQNTPAGDPSDPREEYDPQTTSLGDSSDPRDKKNIEKDFYSEGDDKLPASKAEELEAHKLGHEAPSLYKPDESKKKSFIDSLKSNPGSPNWRKRGIIGGGLGVILILIITISLTSFLGFFKLDSLVSSLENKVAQRTLSGTNERSSKYTRAYITVRMLESNDNLSNKDVNKNNNLFFRSSRVDTNSPFSDWYKTLRASQFEADLFERQGIKFASVIDANGNPKPAFIDVRGTRINVDMSSADLAMLKRGDFSQINRIENVMFTKFDNDKEARRYVNQVLKDNTHFYQVFKRRMLRKAIFNMTGVRTWKFFEDKRNQIDDAKFDIRAKFKEKTTPNFILEGKFLNCLLGVADKCTASGDQMASQNRATGSINEQGDFCATRRTAGCEEQTYDRYKDCASESDEICQKGDNKEVDDKGNSIKDTDAADNNEINRFARSILKVGFAAANVIEIIAILELIENIDDNLANNNLSKMAAITRGSQAAMMFQTMETARDQTKSSELQGKEYNQFMQMMNNYANSEGFAKVVQGSSTASAATLTNTPESRKYCSRENQDLLDSQPRAGDDQFHYLCADKQVGGSGNAAKIEAVYQDTFGYILGPIAGLWEAMKGAFGGFLGKVIKYGYRYLNYAFSAVTTKMIAFMKLIPGVGEAIKNFDAAVSGLMKKIMTFLGLGPIVTGQESSGILFNWIVQGGAYTYEGTNRMLGAAETNPQTKAVALKNVNSYQDELAANQSVFDTYLSLENTESIAHKSLFAVSNLQGNSFGELFAKFGSLIGSIPKALASPFTGSSEAQSPYAYDGSDFAGIQTYDFEGKCVNSNPLDSTMLSGTNIFNIFNQYGISHTGVTELGATTSEQWETLNNSDKFYDYLYKKIGDRKNPDEVSLKVYNCHLLDTAVRGSMGFVYGYDKDYGYPEAPEPTNQPSSGGGGGGECDRAAVFPGYEEGGYGSDTEYMEKNNPAPSGEGSNYGKGPAPVKFPGACRGPGSDDAHDLSYTRNASGDYVDSTGQRFDGKGLKK